MVRAVRGVWVSVLLSAVATAAGAQTLKGSPVAMQKQNRIAQQHDYTFLQTSAEVRRFVDLGLLVPLRGNSDYALDAVSHAYARPAVKLFVERLASQYRAACGEKLVVTSLTRPVREQPRNASELSVHPAGMAVDLRISTKTKCRNWLEKTVLGLEKQGLLDAIRERRPPHYHIALFPEPYTRYVAKLTPSKPARATTTTVATTTTSAPVASTESAVLVTAEPESTSAESTPDAAEAEVNTYRVHRGDTLWSIARRHSTTVNTLKELNGLKSTQLITGQVIAVPTAPGAAGS